ncbi:hypothetical protein PRZ48_006551 [Zasmidium cellare]|uniref:BTB domain-containing protein n=1 Tax=Zasmidium cellare TaxID=395010 RepID=A0ABR0ENF7_ZASCE|nr:hypothetical protein PRZ48_006551 [Zasmidium cellare]
MASTTPLKSNREKLINGIEGLYKSDWNSDLVIKGGSGKEWKVHTIIVCLQSKVFKTKCKNEWQVSDNNGTYTPKPGAFTDSLLSLKKDSQQKVIELTDEPDLLIDQLVRFLYLAKYDAKFCKTTESPWGPMQFHLKMFIAADKYDIQDLAGYAKQEFLSKLERVDSPADRRDFIHAVYELYQASPASETELRAKAVEVGTSNSYVLLDDGLKEEDGKENDLTFHRLLREIPEFGDQVVVALSAAFAEKKKNSVGTATYRCEGCRSQFVITNGRCDVKIHCPECRKAARKLW